MSLLDDIRRAIRGCGRSMYQLARQTEIDQAVLSRFLAGKQGLSMRSLEALAQELRLRLVKEDRA